MPFRREVMEAVANGKLPVRPGDMIWLPYSAKMLLVVAVTGQRTAPADEAPGSGQWIEYVVSDDACYLEESWMSWHGFDTFWKLVRE